MQTLFWGARALVITDGRTDTKPAPLLIALHGFTGTGASLQRKTGFDRLARQNRFVVVYPSSHARRWDDSGDPSDDVAYLSALITELVAEGRADPAHVYIAGHSNGGAMAMRMACARPDLIRAIAVVAMNMPRQMPCPVTSPMPAVFIH